MANPATGPPEDADEELLPAPAHVITWLFDPESFAPAAKLVDGQRYSTVTDYLGTPTAMLDSTGHVVWSASISIYGDLRNVQGDRHACPFRWPGQYEDEETGLHYNRFRYYDTDAGQYISQDPIGLVGGSALYAYVHDPLGWVDPLGLAKSCTGSAPKGRGKNKLRPDPNAEGAHSTFRRNPDTGKVEHHAEWDADGFPVQRTDITGATHAGVPTPHTHIYGPPNTNPATGVTYPGKETGIRPATPGEIPK